MRLYGRRFWAAVGLGIPPTLLGILLALLTERDVQRTARLFAFVVLFALIGSLCLIVANRIASDRPAEWLELGRARGGNHRLPPPAGARGDLLSARPDLVCVSRFRGPRRLFESRSLGGAFRRAIQLARADYAHALGSLAAVTIVALISAGVMSYLLVQFGDQARGAAAFIAVLLLSPLLFLAAALLYEDQVARLEEH